MTPEQQRHETMLTYKAEHRAQSRIARNAQARADELSELLWVVYGERVDGGK